MTICGAMRSDPWGWRGRGRRRARGGARRDPDGRIEPQGFGEVLPGERETHVVRGSGDFAGEHAPRFFVEALLPFGMERGEPESEAEAVGRGSWPASRRVRHSSRTWRSVMLPVWPSVSTVARSMESRSPWSIPHSGAALPDEAVDERVELGFAPIDAAHDRAAGDA